MKTTNGGATWSEDTTTLVSSQLYDIHFANASVGWMVVGGGTVPDSGSVLKTTDGGESWTPEGMPQIRVPGDLMSIHFIDSTTGWAAGQDGIVIKTTDGGTTWTPQVSGTTSTLRSLHFISSSGGWAVGDDGTIIATSDGGTTWTAQTSNTNFRLNAVHFAHVNSGWAVGNATVILKYTGSSTPVLPGAKAAGRLALQAVPAGAAMRIRFELPSPEGRVSLKVHDLAGAEVATLVHGPLAAGVHELEFDASALSRGTYFYVLRAGDVREVRRTVKMR